MDIVFSLFHATPPEDICEHYSIISKVKIVCNQQLAVLYILQTKCLMQPMIFLNCHFPQKWLCQNHKPSIWHTLFMPGTQCFFMLIT